MWLFFGDDKSNLKMVDRDCCSGDMAISIQCQFLLTLAILRRDYNYSEAAQIFGLATEENAKSHQAYRIVSTIFKTWLIYMDRKFRYVTKILIKYILRWPQNFAKSPPII